MYFFKSAVLFSITALFCLSHCKNKDRRSDTPDSPVEVNPAYQNLNDSIRRFPEDAGLYLRRAMRLTLENQHELAYDDFHRAWALNPSLDNTIPYAANLEILGRHKERVELLESADKHFPSTSRIRRLLADAYASSGNAQQALRLYNDMLTRDSLDPETFYEKALLLEQLTDTDRAIAALQRAYALQGVDTYGLELAHLYAEQRNSKALDICNFILRQDSAQLLIDPLFIKGIYYSNIKQYPKAIAQFDSCILRDWKTTDAYLEKGRAYFMMENFDAARQTFNLAITVSNTDADAYYWLGRCYEAMHRKTDAVVNYRKALSLERGFTEAKQRLDKLDPEFAHPSH